jgi:thioredoxin reductase
MRDLIIVGAGPAGLAAALYATRKRLNYLVLSNDLGGKSNYRVELPDIDESYIIRARELVTLYKSRLEYLRHSYRLEGVSRIELIDEGFRITTEKESQEDARSVIVATGTRFKPLDVPGEKEFRSRGLGYSSISYSHLFDGKRVFLAGDTSRVLGSALELSIHADEVVVALLNGGDYDEQLLEFVANLDGVTLIRDAEITEFRGDEYAREVVVNGSGDTSVVRADGFFVEPHPVPNTEFLLGVLDLTPSGHLQVDSTNMTVKPGLFAAGDVTGNGFEQILVALGDGAKAVLSAYRYLLHSGSRQAV